MHMETTFETLQFTIKSSILDRPRKLSIAPAYIEFDNRSSVGLEPTRFFKEDIEGVRYGIKAIDGYQFTIGRIYCIDICNAKGGTIKIRLKSLYGVRKTELGRKYSEIVNAILDYFFDPKIISLLEKFVNDESFSILGVNFDARGVLLKKDSQLISWDDLGTKSYMSYYAMFSKSDPNYYRAFEYLNDWNTVILYSVSRQILKEKGFWNE
jgi:hypothetical protein